LKDAKTGRRGNERQRVVAAQTARENFTRYPRWEDPATGELKALSLNPFYDICRKVQDLAEGEAALFAIVPEWAGRQGLFAFVSYCYASLPARPTPFHVLRTIDGTELLAPSNVRWEFVAPSRKQLYRDEARLAFSLFGERDRGAVMTEGWVEKITPYVLREKGSWSVDAVLQSDCLCAPESYWAGCSCAFVTEQRYGDPRIGALFAGSVRGAAEEDV
jgi:hypothetical protein